jgi:outer membrane receptor protein involved in Fe transport
MSIETALTRLLAQSRCGFTLPDRRTVLIRAAATGVASPPPRPSAPQPKPKPKPTVTPLGEIVVTAPRYPNLPGRTPYAISAVAGDRLTREDLLGLQDLTGEVAGMTVTNLGPGRDKILLRGLSDGAFTGQAQSMVALYLDDVPITYSAPDPDLRLTDIERVEVMRGPQGTLYGGGSIGGVVRITTRKPDLDTYSGMLTAGLSSTQGGGLNAEVEVGGNIPLIAGRVAARAVAYRDTQSGYIANTRLGLSHVNTSQRDGVRLAVKVALSPAWTATAALTHQSINDDDTQYGLRRLGSMTRDNAVREPHDNDFDHVSLTLSGAGDWGRLTVSASELAHQFDSRYDASSAVVGFGGPAGPAAFDEAKHVDLMIAEATYATPVGRRLHGLAGAFVSTGEIQIDTRLAPVGRAGGSAVYSEARTDKINEVAIYGEATFDVSPQLSATVGLRWFDFRFETTSFVDPSGQVRRFDGDDDAAGFSPKVLVSYRTDGGGLLYLQAAEGYRPGGFNTAGRIGQAFDTPGAPRRQYEADELWNYEFGAKFRWFADRLQVRVAAFYATWEAIQSDQYTADGLGFTANIGDGDNRGVEVEATWRVNDQFDVRGAALVNDPQITRPDPDFSSRKDVGLPGISNASAGLTLDYHRDLGAERILRLLGQASYVGSSHLTFDADKAHEMGDYISLRASAAIETRAWTLTASVDNPFNAASNSFSFGNPFIINQHPVATPLRPRTVAVRLAARF